MSGYPLNGFQRGNNPLVIEGDLLQSEPGSPYPEDINISLSEFLAADGSTLGITTGAVPYRVANAQDNLPSIRWQATANTGILTTIKIPGQYDPNTDVLEVIATLRQSGTSTTNLAMNVQGRILQPGVVDPLLADNVNPVVANVRLGDDAVTAFTAVASRRLTAHDIALGGTVAVRNIADYWFDLSFRRSTARPAAATEPMRVRPLSILALTLTPSTALAASCLVDLFGVTLRVRRNASLNRKAVRESPFLIR